MLYDAAINTIRGAVRKLTGPFGWTKEEADRWSDGVISLSIPAGAVLAKWIEAAWRRVGARGLADRVAHMNGLLPVT